MKKIFGGLLLPLPVCMFLIITGLVLLWGKNKSLGKAGITMGIVLLYIFSTSICTDQLLIPLEYTYQGSSSQYSSSNNNDGGNDPGNECEAKWIAVLGGGVRQNEELPLTSQLSIGSLVRLIEAVRLHRSGPDSKIILLGGPVFSEMADSTKMNQLALELGVPSNKIMLESDCSDTISQARRLREIVGATEFMLVTSAAHMPRSMAMMENLGMNPRPAPTGYLVSRDRPFSFRRLLPGGKNLMKAQFAVHEYLGILWANMTGQI